MLRQVVHADTEMAGALVDDECSGLERSDSSVIAVIEILERNEVTQQAIEITMEEQQLTERHIFCFGSSPCVSVGCLCSGFSGLPVGYLLTHSIPFSLGHAGLGCILRDNGQTEFLQFLLLKISGKLCLFLFVSSNDICLQRCCRNRLLFYRDGV